MMMIACSDIGKRWSRMLGAVGVSSILAALGCGTVGNPLSADSSVKGVETSDARDAGDASHASDAMAVAETLPPAPSCTDHLLNGDETDVDCGGHCAPCPADARCSADGDCASRRCHGGLCSGSCGMTGLLAYYPLDGDTIDKSPNGHDLTAVGVVAAPGIFGGAYAFDGTRSAMQATGSGMLTGARTLCAWIDPQTASGLGQPVFAGGTPGAGDFFSIQSSTPGGTCMNATAEGEPFVDHWNLACILGTGLAAKKASWSMVCYVFDGAGTQRLFLNGMSHDTSGTNYDYPFSTLTVGSASIGGTTTQAAFRGAIDEVTVWDRALSAPELAQLWNSGRSCVP